MDPLGIANFSMESPNSYFCEKPPKTNMEPENQPLERRLLLETISVRFHVKFGERSLKPIGFKLEEANICFVLWMVQIFFQASRRFGESLCFILVTYGRCFQKYEYLYIYIYMLCLYL